MTDIHYFDRTTKQEEQEHVYGRALIELLYGETSASRWFAWWLQPLIARVPLFSWMFGQLQKSRWSRRSIQPFVQKYQIDATEFLEPVEAFRSFNDFFIRKLKPSARPLAPGHDIAVLPADARYFAYQQASDVGRFWVKGQQLSLQELLQDQALADRYAEGALVLARLCPTDYHRFHFPCNCVPGRPKRINGPLHSVNPLALRKQLSILTQNKRTLTELQTKNFGVILYVEIGATFVGSIHQTFTPGEPYAKGDEKGYFSFGASSLILLFEPQSIQLDQDLLDETRRRLEVKGSLGQSLGRSLRPL